MKKEFDEKLRKSIENSYPEIAKQLDWLENMKKHLTKDIYVREKHKNNKLDIAIVYDIDEWAFGHIAKELKKYLSSYYNIDLIPQEVYQDNPARLLMLASRYDLVHCLWRGVLSNLESDYTKEYIHNLGISLEDFIKLFKENVLITTSVYDHQFLSPDTIFYTETFMKYIDDYSVSSQKLKEIYEEEPKIFKKPLMEITDGVDLGRFSMQNKNKYDNIQNRTVTIGWVGNSKFLDTSKKEDEDLKGVRTIIKPAIEELILEGYPIRAEFADRNGSYVPYEKMPDYYQKVDVYVCASTTEGTPNPVLEAMACGIPIISTDVGIVPEAFGEKQKELILLDRKKELLKEKIKELLNHPELFSIYSEENRKQILQWSWEKKAMQFKEMFDTVLQNRLKN